MNRDTILPYHVRQRILMLVPSFLLAAATFAVPAKPGLTRLLTLTDGTTVNAVLVGDEHGHFWQGADGKSYQMVVGTDTYQEVNSQNIIQKAQQRRAQANQRRTRRLAPRKVGNVGSITGEKKGLIILVNFADKAFTATQSDFYNLANTVNYNSGNYKGSMYDYFYAQSDGQFRLTFDVVGPYTVSKNCAYYGDNDSNGDDVHPAEMVIEALKLADADVNYANYDWDDNGTVEQVYVVYAGKGEADGGAANTIWPHEYDLTSAQLYGDGAGRQKLDGVWINTYACGGEKNGGTGETAGIGTMCHEFSHCLGYPDFYDTDYSGGQGMFAWDLMDSGSYNGNGYQPAGYTSYERWVAGWKTPIELEYTQNISNMAALQTAGSNSYIIYNKGNKDEYYLLENRQKIGWDTSLPGKGLLILHVDYDESVWTNNQPNDDPSHQRMTWIAADNNYQYTTYNGTKYYTEVGAANDPFPYGLVNAFGKNTTPAATLYNNNFDGTKYLDSSVENITQNSDGTISFYFKGIDISAPTGLALSKVGATSFTASWSAVDGADSYELDVVKGTSFEASAGSTVLQSDFSTTTGWTLSGTGTYTGAGYYGGSSPAIKFDGTGDYAISPDFGSGKKLQFWAYGNNGSGSTFAVSGLVNDTWTAIETVTIAQGGATYEVNLPDGTSQVRFDFTKSVNCALDDVVIYGPDNSPESIDGYPKSVGNVTSYAVTGLTSETQYAVRVRAVNSAGNSDWSATATTTTAISNIAPVWSALPTNASITLGEEYELMISDYVSGIPTPTISMTASGSDDAEYDDGYFLFMPTEVGTFNFTFTATNSEGSANVTLTVTVNAAQTSSDDEFALITSALEFVEGDYIIVYNNGAMKASVSSNRLGYEDVTPTNNVITTDKASIIWHIAPSGDYYTIYNAGENKYAAGNGTKNQAQLLASDSDDRSLWSVTTGETFDFVNKYNSANNVNANLRRNDTYGFACYAAGTGGRLSLYKRTSGSIAPAIAYYKNADGKQGSELKTAMCGIIYNRTEQRYDDLWTAYQTTDVRSDGKIWDMYSNITNYDPVNDSHSNSAEGSGFNREHSFPKSWFGGEVMPMYTDLHHLYPVDGNINTRRSNNPYGETNGEEYKSANDFSKLGTCTYPGYTGKVFEPADEYKGDFARTYFYMVTCYEEKLHDWYTNFSSTEVTAVIDGSTYPGLQTWQLNMLMKWAKNDPVSEKETNRNNAVYAIQNNRNPFIDYPGLEEYIWGSLTTTPFSYDNYVGPVYKQDVSMSFSPTEVMAILGEDFTEPTLSTTPANLTVTYSSSDESVATVNASTGEVTLVADGTTIITATFAGNDTYNIGSASYTLIVGEPALAYGETLLYEGLSNYSGSDASQAMASTYQYLDYKGWSSLTSVFAGGTSNARSNGGCLKFGSGSAAGSMSTGNIPLTGDGTLTFYLKQYGSDAGKLNVTVEGATANVTPFTPTSDWTLCTVNLTNADGNVTITLATTSKRAYVDEIKLTSNGTLYLANNGNNTTNIAAATNNGGKFNVTLKDRTLYKDGSWNTLCLPFDVDLSAVGCPLAGTELTVMALDRTKSNLTEGTLTLTFTPVYDGDTKGNLTAGTPYIIKWAKDTDNPTITAPVFNGVTINNTAPTQVSFDGGSFIGTYSPVALTPNDESNLFLGANNTLHHPSGSNSADGNYYVKACRAYFHVDDGAQVKDFVLNFGDDATGLASLSTEAGSRGEAAGSWFTLDGRKLDGKPTAKGLYIHGGRKVIVQ